MHYQVDRRQVLRIFGAMAAAGATAGLAAACGPDVTTPGKPSGLTVRVGLVVPSGGPFARIGQDIQRGFQLYLDRNQNRLGPHTAQIVTVDEGTTVQSAVAAVKSLLDQQVIAVAGVTNPDALGELAGELQQAQVPLVSSHVALATLTNALFIWRASCVAGDAGRAIASFARNEGRKAYIMSDETSAGRAEAAAFRGAFQDVQGQVVGEVEGAGSLATRMQAARTLGADVIFAAYSDADALAVMEAYRVAGLNAKLLGPASLADTIDLPSGAKLPDGVFTSMFYASNLANEANSRFVTAYYQRHQTQPTGYSTAGYDTAAVLGSTLALVTGTPTGATLNQAFSKLGQIDSPRGTWAFNINRSPQQRWYLRRLQLDGAVPGNLLDSELAVQG